MKYIHALFLLSFLLWPFAAGAQAAKSGAISTVSPALDEIPLNSAAIDAAAPNPAAVLDRSELLAGSSREVRKSLQPALEQFPQDASLAEIAAYESARRGLPPAEPRIAPPGKPCPPSDSTPPR